MPPESSQKRRPAFDGRAVVLDRRPRRVYHLAGYARVRNGNGDPFLFGLYRETRLPAVAPSVLRWLGYLPGAHPQPVVPPDAVELLAVQACRHLRGDQRLDLLVGVGLVHIIQDRDPEERPVPTLASSGRGDALALEGPKHSVQAVALGAHHAEDAPHVSHLLLVYQQPVARGVELEAVLDAMAGHDLTLAGLLELASPGTLGYLRALVLAELVQYAIRKLALRAVVSPIVQGPDLRPVLLELAPEKVMVGGLAGDAVPILCKHHGNAPGGH